MYHNHNHNHNQSINAMEKQISGKDSKGRIMYFGKKKKIFFFFLFLFSLVAIFYQYQLVSIAPNVPMKCDPSAGSPTETLLRLLLPLDDKAYQTFCEATAPAVSIISPTNSPDHPIGRSDGRCVQRAGTYSARVDDSRLQGIPRSRCTIAIIYPQHDAVFKIPQAFRPRSGTRCLHHCSARAAQNI